MQLLENGKQQFIDQNGAPLVGGQVFFYLPATLTPAPTYQDQAGLIPNTNPILLDSNGQAIIWGTGSYRQIVKNQFGQTIWDQIVASPLSSLSSSSGAQAIGYSNSTLDVLLKSNLGRVVNSIAALRGTDKTAYTEAFVTGYYAQGDGGGGAYYYDSTDTTSIDNGGTIIVASDGGRWKLVSLGGKVAYAFEQFGAKGDGVTDDLPALTRLIAALGALGGGVGYGANKTYAISGPVVISHSSISLEGAGGNWYHDVVWPTTGTIFKYIGGTAAIPVIQFASPSGATLSKCNGGGIKDIKIDGNMAALIGFQMLSWNAGLFQNITIYGVTGTGILLQVQTALGEARDNQFNRFTRVAMRLIDPGADSANGLYADGDTSANTSFNIFEQISIAHKNGVAFNFACSDNNVSNQIYAIRTGGGTGFGLGVFGNNNPLLAADSNVFNGVSCNSPIHIYGTETFTTPSKNTIIRGLDKANSVADPIIGTNTNCLVEDTRGRIFGLRSIGASGGGNNLAGSVSYGAATPAISVTFPTAEPDSNYNVAFSIEGGNPGAYSYISAKNSAGFTITFSTSTANAGVIHWIIVRV